MFAQWKELATPLFAAALFGISAETALAQDHDHSHSHDVGEPARLTLNNGKKWGAGDSLRQGMGRIRDALEAELPAIHSEKATGEQYRALAQKINGQITFMVENCKLEPEMDAMLHLVLADIIAGADAMAAQHGKAARKGAEKVVHALENYGTYFDHPGWHGVKHAP